MYVHTRVHVKLRLVVYMATFKVQALHDLRKKVIEGIDRGKLDEKATMLYYIQICILQEKVCLQDSRTQDPALYFAWTDSLNPKIVEKY